MISTLTHLILHILTTSIFLPHLISAQCDVPDNIGHLTPDIKDWEKESYDEDSTMTFKCEVGHREDSGNGLSTCVKTGSDFKWTEPDLVCQPIQCVPPVRPENGRIIGSTYTFGQKIQFECDRGYKFENRFSKREVVCLADGQWSGASPKCVEVLCPTPEDIPNGEPQYTTIRLDFKVTYKCKSGYKIEGSAERICQEDGTWSNALPQCLVVRCPNPTQQIYQEKYGLSNAVLRSGLSPGHKVKFTCKNGKELESTCTSNGDWSPPPPCISGDTSSTAAVTTPLPTTIITSLLPIITTLLPATFVTEPDSTLTPPITDKIPGSTDSTTGVPFDGTTAAPESSSGLPSWLIVLIAFAGSAVIILIIGLLTRHFLRKRKRDIKNIDVNKTDAEMESLANTKAHFV